MGRTVKKEPNYKLGYKVLFNGGSARMRKTRRFDTRFPSAHVQYPKGKWAKPNPGYGPLAVFTSRKAAEMFLAKKPVGVGFPYNGENPETLHRCLYAKSKTRGLHFKGEPPRIDGPDIGLYSGKGYPEGTDFADKVMVLD